MARGWIGLNSRGTVSTGISFGLGGGSRRQVTRGQGIFAAVFVIGFFAYINYGANHAHDHDALKLRRELTMTDVWANRDIRARAEREGRPLIDAESSSW